MNKLAALALALTFAPAVALAHGTPDVHIGFFAPPALAVIRPGVQVVVDHNDKIFYVGHRYWVRRDHAWYSAGHYADNFAFVSSRHVPHALTRLPPGQYRHYAPGARHGNRGVSHGGGNTPDYHGSHSGHN